MSSYRGLKAVLNYLSMRSSTQVLVKRLMRKLKQYTYLYFGISLKVGSFSFFNNYLVLKRDLNLLNKQALKSSVSFPVTNASLFVGTHKDTNNNRIRQLTVNVLLCLITFLFYF
ncbi:hypothetical protein Barb4_02313 [Bacteroidales bacterium Barb4]|nr:hypothetical protein Barb4_02313 [Bacteroidales bacterium Barb4]